ncbi:MAG: CRISPR-associated protein Csm7 [Methylomonas sp.]|uniref:type III-A CRISPR-associated RAMP protein Csm4 n=1 Tax=Methylomonas sp. TaxID=418 RepID=UPI0025FFEFAB|nr:CRISPR-associated protein Csm7 [Methylomonas sp.]MCK9607783.1 CRISPR-associated protein Csm7 [Methylomonas sp.]
MTIQPLSAFATALKGDTLFGQLCWAIRNRFGEERLTACLNGYNQNQPFIVLSDAFPQGYLPLPKLPSCFYQTQATADRKALKKRNWLPISDVVKPIDEWQLAAVDAKTISAGNTNNLSEKHPQPHNTINRQTNTTGENGFAPYSVEQEWFTPQLKWTIHLLLDTAKLSLAECQQCLEDIGQFGFGKDASIGMGKFSIDTFVEQPLPAQNPANACLTLAPCAPQGLGFDADASYYQLFTRFGRHGDIAVHQQGKPFKNPILLAQTAAVFTTPPPATGFIGQGIGGNGELSNTISETVHQGYAPVIAVHLSKATAGEICQNDTCGDDTRRSDAHIAT